MDKVAELFDRAMLESVTEILNTKREANVAGYIFDTTEVYNTDNIGQMLEKLCILHVRTWMLEDQVEHCKTDEQLASVKRKLDICNKIVRPKLIAAINQLIDYSIIKNKQLTEGEVKQYKGF